MVWIYAHGLDIFLGLIFVTFVNFCHFLTLDSMNVIDSGYLVSTTPYTISCLSLCNFVHIFFFHGLKMCMWFGFNPAVNFCHFSTLFTLSSFADATSTSPKFDLYLLIVHTFEIVFAL